MKTIWRVLLITLPFAGMFALTAHAQTSTPAPGVTAPVAAGDIAVLFAPILAAATGIERSLEMFWNWLESLFLQFISFIAMGYEWTQWAREEVATASKAISDLAAQLSALRQARQKSPAAAAGQDENALLLALRDAEAQLLSAQTRLQNTLKSDRYRRLKSSLSVLLGFILGVLVAAAARLKMFALLGITQVPTEVDIFITGLVIGTGSAPVHSLIGILQSGKDTLVETSRLLQGRYEQAVNSARNPDMSTMRTSDGKLSTTDYSVYLNRSNK